MRTSNLTLAAISLSAMFSAEARAACPPTGPMTCVALTQTYSLVESANCNTPGETDQGQVEQVFELTDPTAISHLSASGNGNLCYYVSFSHISLLSAEEGLDGERSRARFAGMIELDALGDLQFDAISESLNAPDVRIPDDEVILYEVLEIDPLSFVSPSVKLTYTGALDASGVGNEAQCEDGDDPEGGVALAISQIDPTSFAPTFCYSL